MQTPTHLLIAAAVLARQGANQRNRLVLAGALAPDAFLFGVWGWSKMVGIPEGTLWREVYWTAPVQWGQAFSNSIPLFAALLAVALWRHWRLAAVFAGAALIHLLCDFPVHGSDAHQHFQPLTDWRFHSPISYWERDRFGLVVGAMEAVLAIGLMMILWRRFTARNVRIVLGFTAALYVLTPAYFIISL